MSMDDFILLRLYRLSYTVVYPKPRRSLLGAAAYHVAATFSPSHPAIHTHPHADTRVRTHTASTQLTHN